MIRFSCPGCNKVYKTGDELAGRKTSCKQCGAIVLVPEVPIQEVLYGMALPPEGVVEATPEPDPEPPQIVTPQTSWQARTREEPSHDDPTPPRRRRQYEHDDEADYDFTQRRRRRLRKSRLAYIVLALFFGGLGIHNFYANRTTVGLCQLVIFVVSIPLMCIFIGWVTIFIPSLWALLEIIVVDRDGHGLAME